MKRIKVLGLALVALFAVSAMAAAQASAALPELVKEGKAGVELAKKTIKGSGKELVLETMNGSTVKCGEATSIGTGAGVKEFTKTVVTFTKCKASIGGECENAGAGTEKIVTNSLDGEIGYISKTAKTVGVDLKPEVSGPFVTFTCASFATNEVTGSVIGEITPVNKSRTVAEGFTLTYEKGASAGEQKIKNLEGKPEDVLSSKLFGKTEKANQQGKITLKFEETAEILA